jgi:hypothetical protein
MATNGSRFNPVGALLHAWTNKGDAAHPKATLSETLGKEGWNIIRDKNAMRSGDLISGFMKRIGLADRVIVVLSDKYLHSRPSSIPSTSDLWKKKRTFCDASSH